MTRRLLTFLTVLAVAIAAGAPASAMAGGSFGGGRSGGGGSFGGSKSSSPSSSSRPSAGSRPSVGSRPGVSSRPAAATPARPSTGPKQQPAPVKKIIPPAPPKLPTTAPGAGRGGSFLDRSPGTRKTVDALGQGNHDWGRNRDFVASNPRYANPYYHGRGYTRGPEGTQITNVYYGDTTSPLIWMWAGGFFDGDHRNDPLPPQTEGAEVSTAILSYMQLIEDERKMLNGEEPTEPAKAGATP